MLRKVKPKKFELKQEHIRMLSVWTLRAAQGGETPSVFGHPSCDTVCCPSDCC